MSLNLKTTAATALGLVIVAGTFAGCATTKEIDRTQRRPHTAMRGPAYKRLILTYNEANNLAYRSDRYAKALRDAGSVDQDTLLSAYQLAEDLAKFADDIEWSLTNTQRMSWHQSEMNGYWDRFLELYPEDEAFVDGYKSKDMRKVTRKLDLKNQEEYRDLHEYQRHDTNWGSLFHPTGESVYTK